MTDSTKKDKGVTFSVDLLFSEPLHFNLSEIVEAVNEDNPSCQVKDIGLLPSNDMRTDQPVMGVLFPVEAHDGSVITMFSAGIPDESFRTADHTEAYWRSGGFGEEAVQQHQSYLHLSVTAVENSLAANFRAARLLNVVTAVFAKLPITLAVNVLWSGLFARPDQWVKAADQAIKGEWPMMSWLSYRVAWDGGPGRSSDFSVGDTVGLKCFLPYELQIEAAPIKPTEVMHTLVCAASLPLQDGNVFEDGHTVGVEGGPRYRLRMRKTADGLPNGLMVLLHPESPLDEVSEFGKRPGIETPIAAPFMAKPKTGFMRNILGRN